MAIGTTEAVTAVARVIQGIQKFFSREEKHERAEDSLISTGDNLVHWLDKPKKRNGEDYSPAYIKKKVDAYVQKWKDRRKKLK